MPTDTEEFLVWQVRKECESRKKIEEGEPMADCLREEEEYILLKQRHACCYKTLSHSPIFCRNFLRLSLAS
jgi:hypothetical protein